MQCAIFLSAYYHLVAPCDRITHGDRLDDAESNITVKAAFCFNSPVDGHWDGFVKAMGLAASGITINGEERGRGVIMGRD